MKGVLVRVGIDGSCGEWNGPCDPQKGRFVYVPIPEGFKDLRPELSRTYDEVVPALSSFGVTLPSHLDGCAMHLDPDFETLTYGDTWPRSQPILDMRAGDFIAFYASLRPAAPNPGGLVYAIIGFFTVAEIVNAADVPMERWGENAHTRRRVDGRNDIIVRADARKSGRLDRAIPIGEWRQGSYRVSNHVLSSWGDLKVKNGYIQRSGRPPMFDQPERFIEWLDAQAVRLLKANNP